MQSFGGDPTNDWSRPTGDIHLRHSHRQELAESEWRL
jgi:hypothetical protein